MSKKHEPISPKQLADIKALAELSARCYYYSFSRLSSLLKMYKAFRRSRNRVTDAIILVYGTKAQRIGVFKIKFKK